jgi:hypothetical protein
MAPERFSASRNVQIVVRVRHRISQP